VAKKDMRPENAMFLDINGFCKLIFVETLKKKRKNGKEILHLALRSASNMPALQ